MENMIKVLLSSMMIGSGKYLYDCLSCKQNYLHYCMNYHLCLTTSKLVQLFFIEWEKLIVYDVHVHPNVLALLNFLWGNHGVFLILQCSCCTVDPMPSLYLMPWCICIPTVARHYIGSESEGWSWGNAL